MNKYCRLILFSLLPSLVLSPTKSFSQFEEDDNHILNEFIVMLKPTHSIDDLINGIPSVKIKECLSQRMNIYLLERNTSSSAEDFLSMLRQNEHVKLAQFNHTFEKRALVPNDTFFNLQWNMLNTGASGGIAGADIDATDAWAISNDAITANGDSIVIAIIDGKVDLYHEDLNYFRNYAEVPGNGIDDDGNEYIDDINGWNASINNGNTYSPPDNHTMHSAGIAAARGDNRKGVSGVCWGAKILPVVYGSAIESNVFKAYDYVRTMRIIYNSTFGTRGAFVVAANTSFGVNNGKPTDYPIWCAMFDSMGYVGILSAGATANSNVDVDVVYDIPTACPSKYLIAVTNTMNNDQRNTGSAYGKINIDLGAPGTNIYSTYSANTYSNSTGTSMSAPHVAGTVAAMFSAACKPLIDRYYEYPDSIALLVKDYLLEGAEWNSSLNNITVTSGRLNLHRAFLNLDQFNCDSCSFNIHIDKIPISCKSAADGTLAVTVDTGSILDYNILWSNNVTDPQCQNLGPGYYTVVVRDTTNGCRRFTNAELHNPDTIIVSAINTIPSVGGNPGNIIVVASAGSEILMYSLDGINYQQTPTFSIPANGAYTVYIKNSLGCVVQQSVIVSGMAELAVKGWQLMVYPNPADYQLTIDGLQFNDTQAPLEIFDLTGRKILETIPFTVNCQLSTANFESGVYFLRFGNTTKKFAVMH